MKLKSVAIRNFRSIDSGGLECCDRFNVLIGKNNSGKSNILLAIDAFFSCAKDGGVVYLDPPLGQEIDFHSKNTKEPIEITLQFSLTLAERDGLLRDIVTDAPQMKNAVDGIDSSLSLKVRMRILPPPDRFAVFAGLTLVSEVNAGFERDLLELGEAASLEIYRQLAGARRQTRDAGALAKINLDEIRMVLEYKERVRTGSEYLLRHVSDEVSRETKRALDSIVSAASSKEEMQREIRALETRLRDEAQATTKEPLQNKAGTFAGEESSILGYVRKILAQISEIKILHLRERRKVIGKEEAKRLLDLKVRRGGTEALRSIQETVVTLLGVHIDAFQGGFSSPARTPEAELDVDNFLVQVNGSGVREALRLILDYEFERPHILLVEEPEVHLHPALETSMMRYLKKVSGDCQVFLTTHSTNFLDTAEMKNVYLISRADSTRARLLNVDEAEASIPRELGIRLSSFFMFDRLVFVEGPTDEDVIREWASVLGVNLSQGNVGFIHMGGVRNLAHFAAEKTISFLARRQVQMWFVIDRDERSREEITQLQQRIGGGGKIKVLRRREIENYLVQPRAIMELIREKSQGKSPVPEEREVKEAIYGAAEELKQAAIDKRVVRALCLPIYPAQGVGLNDPAQGSIEARIMAEFDQIKEKLDAAKQEIGRIVKENEATLGQGWSEEKLAIVPGAMLLDKVLHKYGFRFVKARDSARLAALMRREDIDQEVKEIIEEIAI